MPFFDILVFVPSFLNHLLQPIVVPLRRFGNKKDGGYLLPEASLISPLAVISLGMGDDWSFEQSLSKAYPDTIVHTYDPTMSIPIMIHNIKKNISFHSLKTLIKYILFFKFSNKKHFVEWVGESLDNQKFTTSSVVFDRIPYNRNIILKIDIEGSEYSFFDQLFKTYCLNRVTAIVVEFHHLYDDYYWNKFETIQDQLLQQFDLVHVHANNYNKLLTSNGIPAVLEFTYLKKSNNLLNKVRRLRLPLHQLDYPNCVQVEDFVLTFQES